MKKKVIIDVDSVGDDILEILYMVCHEEAELLGITTVTGAAGAIRQAAWVAKKHRRTDRSGNSSICGGSTTYFVS